MAFLDGFVLSQAFGGDSLPPSITNISPADGTELTGGSTPVTFDVTDQDGILGLSVITLKYATTPGTIVVHDGSVFLAPFNIAASSRTVIAGGFTYTILPLGGWRANIGKLTVHAVDLRGNIIP